MRLPSDEAALRRGGPQTRLRSDEARDAEREAEDEVEEE